MLKEIFVIEDGVNIFHFAPNSTSNNVDPVLSSGFFSALQSFTHSRSSEINSYSSESEIVIFKNIMSTNKNLVAIFSTKADEAYAERMLNRIEKIICKSKIMFQMNIDHTGSTEGNKIKNRIEKLLKLSTSQKAQIELANKLFKSHDSDLLIIYDIKKRKSVLRKADNEIKKSFANELIILDEALDALIQQLNLGEEYNFVTVETDNKHISIFKDDKKVTFAQGSSRSDDYVKLPLIINGYIETDEFLDEFLYLTELSKWKMDQDNSFSVIRGTAPYWREEQSCSDLVEKAYNFMNNLFGDIFFKIQIYISNPKMSQLIIQRQFTMNSHEFTIFQDQSIEL
ncbi:MAG: hypothetical protein GPJ54_16465 [Candidatus Heimdallarchaeota archaeon]|nr:hypothetical protein [Candidatus Heimdallarchaeota archaeon]